MINDIYEQRKRTEEGFHITLSISKEAYTGIYGDKITNKIAEEIVNNYLQHKDDDGEPEKVKIYEHDEGNMIEIEAILNYRGNEHKDYDRNIEDLADGLGKVKTKKE